LIRIPLELALEVAVEVFERREARRVVGDLGSLQIARHGGDDLLRVAVWCGHNGI